MARRGATTADLSIEYTPMDEVQGWTRNPKDHDLPKIMASLREHGFVAPLLIDGTTGRLVAGHGRLEALAAIRQAGEAAPEGVHGDDWQVPTIRGVSFETEAGAETYLLADNRLVEAGEWDEDGLLAMLNNAAEADLLHATGFGNDDLERLNARLNAPEADDGPVLPPEPALPTQHVQDAPNVRLREVVMMYGAEDYAALTTALAQARAKLGTETMSETITRAVREVAAG